MKSAIFRHIATGKLKSLPKFYQSPMRVDFQKTQGYEFLGLGTFDDFQEKPKKVVKKREPRAKKVVEPIDITEEQTEKVTE
jgi:hypothetical protein